jgi:hypothetical protein
MDSGDFPVMQDNSSGFNIEAQMLQQAMMRASGRKLSSFSSLDRELARAVARAEDHGADGLDVMRMPM